MPGKGARTLAPCLTSRHCSGFVDTLQYRFRYIIGLDGFDNSIVMLTEDGSYRDKYKHILS